MWGGHCCPPAAMRAEGVAISRLTQSRQNLVKTLNLRIFT